MIPCSSQEFKVPEGFPEILRDFTREVLRDQPKDTNKYGEARVPDSFVWLRHIRAKRRHLMPWALAPPDQKFRL